MKKNVAYYKHPLPNQPKPFHLNHSYMLWHVKGHPNCTPNHLVYTSPITRIYKNGRFHTKSTIWILDKTP